MNSTTLVLPTDIATSLDVASRVPLETAGVLLASIVETAGTTRILARRLLWVDDDAYARRKTNSLSILSSGYVPALGEAELMGAAAIWLHTHPGSGMSPMPSRYDVVVDQELADLFRLRTGSPYYGSVIVSPSDDGITFTGKLAHENGSYIAIDRAWVVGDRFRMVPAFGSVNPGLSPAYDRNVRAFGSRIQGTLRNLRIGVVGCGGTGSAVAEQLARLGVEHLTLVDPEDLAESNVSRVYGSTPQTVGFPKVDVVGRHLESINPHLTTLRFKSTVNVEHIARALAPCDVVFGCTDDNAGRLVLSRLATYLLVPVIDCGVLLSGNENAQLTDVNGRVTTLVPGQACLVCRGRIDLARAAAESLTPDERVRRADEGYAPTLGAVEPAVVTFTTSVAAAAVSELLERLVGYGPEPRPSEILLRFHDREVSTNRASPREGHYCHPSTGKIGAGDTKPYLDQTWLA